MFLVACIWKWKQESKENFEIGTSTEANKRKLNFLLLFVWLLRKLNARIEN